jgi:hypothetical protein
MSELHEFDQEFLDELSKKAVNDPHIQLLLDVIAELNMALHEKRELKANYGPILGVLMAAHGACELDVIRFVSSLKSR